MKVRILSYLVGAGILYLLSSFYGVDRLSSYIQVISFLPVFYLTEREISRAYKKHKEGKRHE